MALVAVSALLAGCAGGEDPAQETTNGTLDDPPADGAPTGADGDAATGSDASDEEPSSGGADGSDVEGQGADGEAPELAVAFVGEATKVEDEFSTYLVGEVENTGTAPLGFVQVAATLYDADGHVVGSESTTAMLDRLEPGERSPYKLHFGDAAASAHDYKLSVTGDRAWMDAVRAFETSGVTTRTDDLGWLHVLGEATNTGDRRSDFTKVVVALYDADGRILDADWTTTDPDTVAAGGTASFDLAFMREGLDPADHRVWVEGS